MALRQYQSDDEANILEALNQYNSVLYQLPTGGGKSVVMTSVIERFKDQNIIVFAHKRQLLFQLRDHFKKIGITAGVLAGQFEENLDSNILIVSIRTAVKDARLEKILEKDWDMCMIDEARNSRTASYDKVLDALREKHPNYKLFGVDATPYRKDKKRLDKHFQHLVISGENIASLQQKGFLQKCLTIVSPINKQDLEEQVKEVANDYQLTALSNYMRQPKYLNYVVSQYIERGEGRQAAVFAVDKAHARDLEVVFSDNGFAGKVVRIDSDCSESELEEAFARMRSGDAQILINVEMVTEGIDIPSIGCIVGARPTKSLTLFMQIVGRAMRPDGMFDYCIILDCCGWTEEYGVIATPKHWSLNPEIDPNGARLVNKIFGKHPVTGELIEDLTDFIGEVIELTPEEYLQKIQGGKERAEQINLSIDDKILINVKIILGTLIDVGKFNDYEITYDFDASYCSKIFFSLRSEIKAEKELKGTILINHCTYKDGSGGEFIYCSIDKNSYYGSINSFNRKAAYKISHLVGDMNERLLKDESNKIYLKSFETIESIKELIATKINIRQFDRAQQQLEEQNFTKTVEDHAKLIKKFDFNNKLSFGNYFKENYNSVMGGNIVAIGTPNGKINGHHNTITLFLEIFDKWDKDEAGKDRRVYRVVEEEKKYVKGEKVFELIKNGKWQVEVEK